MTRLLRAMPEIMTLLLGMVAAFRSVFFTLLLLVLFLYVFGIIFRTLGDSFTPPIGSEDGDEFFPTVTYSMWMLLMHCTFLDNVTDVGFAIEARSYVMTFLFVFFIFLSSFTVLNMLIGILCQIVSDVKKEKDQQSEFGYLRISLFDIFECYSRSMKLSDNKDELVIGKADFKMLVSNPEVVEALVKFGTDITGLETLTDVLFDEGDETPQEMNFEEFLGVCQRVQGDHPVRVTDIVELRSYFKYKIQTEVEVLKARSDVLAAKLGSVERAHAEDTVVVQLTHGDVTKSQRHPSSTTVAMLLEQFPQKENCGVLVATDEAGLEMGAELPLGELARRVAGALLDLRLVEDSW
jgi:hypothetical protein